MHKYLNKRTDPGAATALKVFLGLALLAASSLAEEAPAKEKCFLWTVKSGKATVHMLGSIHFARADFYPLDPAIEQAFEKSDHLVLEINMTPEVEMKAQQLFAEKGLYQGNETLSSKMGEKTLKELKARLEARGMSLALLEKLKPWYLSVILVVLEYKKHGFTPEMGIDKHFQMKALKSGKEILQLETLEGQVETLSFGDAEQQELFLYETVKKLDKVGELMAELAKAWKAGEGEKMAETVEESLAEEPRLKPYYDKIFTERNGAMTEKINGYLKTDKTYFVVVGSAHLVGKTGIVELLKKEKLTVQQIEKTGE